MKSGWSREFEEPIIIPPRGPRGKPRELVTLKDAGEYITTLPTMLARIGIMKALHRHDVREFKPSEKKTQRGKRKLARDR